MHNIWYTLTPFSTAYINSIFINVITQSDAIWRKSITRLPLSALTKNEEKTLLVNFSFTCLYECVVNCKQTSFNAGNNFHGGHDCEKNCRRRKLAVKFLELRNAKNGAKLSFQFPGARTVR